jgi:hypothetical protein
MARLGLLAAPLLLSLLAACGGEGATAPRPSLSSDGNGPNGKNATVRVTPSNATLNALHQTLQLTANVAVTWTSLDPGIATVDGSGLVLAVGPGLARIQGLANRKADTAQVLVRQILAFVQVTPDSITVPLQTADGQPGADTLTAVASDSNGYPIADAVMTWVSDATAVATVTNGIVTAVDTGTTTVRATSGGISDSSFVRVGDIATPYP